MRWVTGVLSAVADVPVADVRVDDVVAVRKLVEDGAVLVLAVKVAAAPDCADTDTANRKLTGSGNKSRIANALAARSAGGIPSKQKACEEERDDMAGKIRNCEPRYEDKNDGLRPMCEEWTERAT